MNNFFMQQFLFLLITFVILIIPGWFFLNAFFHHNRFALLEKFVLSVPISFSIITLLIIILDAFGINLTKQNIAITFISITTTLILASFFIKHKKSDKTTIFTFSKKQTSIIILLIIFTIISKSIFLTNTIFPTATDLGHHMFWVEKITQEQSLPTYQKIKISTQNDSFTQPESIADFIVGEHIIFAVIKTFTNQSTVSTFPSLVLFVINIFTTLMIFIISRRFFTSYKYGSEVAILTLLFIGPLWAISGAGAKFVSGGVVGNLLGNLLIPTILYFFYRAFKDSKATLLVPAIILITTLAYTHHLSTFIFGYIFIFSILGFIIFNKNGFTGYKKIFTLLKNPYVIPLLIIAIVSLIILAPPSYLDRDAISSSVGAPSKSTRTGVPFNQLLQMLGQARFVFGLIGLIILTFFSTLRRFNYKKLIYIDKKNIPTNIYGTSFLFGWGWALILMSLVPHLLKVNIISTRIATYAAFPLAILSGFTIMWIINIYLTNKHKSLIAPQFILSLFLFIIITFTFISGLKDNASSLNAAPKTNEALQTFDIGQYAKEKFSQQIKENNFWLVKDHNYITSDTWLKVFFAYDYSFPLSRSYFKRYETHPNRETCTLAMISEPNSSKAQSCFDNLNVHMILVNTEQDAGQFLSSDDFYRIYQNDELSLFIKK
jgi:hypothetical protein